MQSVRQTTTASCSSSPTQHLERHIDDHTNMVLSSGVKQWKKMDTVTPQLIFTVRQACLQVDDFRGWDTLHRDIIRCVAGHMDSRQLPDLRLLNKHWRNSCDVLITRLSISNHAVSHFGSPSIPLDKVTIRFPTLLSLVVWKLDPVDAHMLSRLTELTVLDLGGTRIDDDSLRHVSALTKLTTLQLWETDIGDEGVKHLTTLLRLSTLSLRDSRVQDSGMESVARLINLTALDLDRTRVSDQGACHLTRLKKLQRLSLWYTPIGDVGASYLSHLTDLTKLNLGFTCISRQGLVYLSELTRLTSLELWGIEKWTGTVDEVHGEEA